MTLGWERVFFTSNLYKWIHTESCLIKLLKKQKKSGVTWDKHATLVAQLHALLQLQERESVATWCMVENNVYATMKPKSAYGELFLWNI